jgi:hypothetical protein
VLTSAERAAAGDRELALWMCWALKESTYKLEFAADPRPHFLPKAIECTSIQRQTNGLYRAEVRGRQGMYPGWLRVKPVFVHALVAETPATLAASIWREVRLSCTTPRVQSTEVERELRTLLRSSGLLDPTDTFELRRTPQPVLQRNGRRCGGVSLSHDGRWGGIAVVARARR